MFVPIYGQSTQPNFKGTTLVLPCISVGLSAQIGLDLYILNEGATKVGYYKSKYINPIVANDTRCLSLQGEGTLMMPCEFYQSADQTLTFMQMRASASSLRKFTEELSKFVQDHGFSNVVVLTSTISPVKRERESNRQLPEIFTYANNFLYKSTQNFYQSCGMRKFGFWMQDTKTKGHQELWELGGEGGAKRLMKTFNKVDIPCQLFVIFCTGGIDFVGGYSYYQFMKNNICSKEESVQRQLGNLNLESKGIKDGEHVHELLFAKDELKVPAGWKMAVSYF